MEMRPKRRSAVHAWPRQSGRGPHLYPRVAGALLDAQEGGVRRQLAHDLVGDVLPGPPRHVVHDRRALVQHRLEVPDQACAPGRCGGSRSGFMLCTLASHSL